jgi:DNA-directed RNA polymerase specialized sigma24 family protein
MRAPGRIEVDAVFADWNARIMRSLERRFQGTPHATLEDGAAFAWERLAAKPPTDDERLLGWLIVVARHEVLRLLRRWEHPHEPLPDAFPASDSLENQLEARELVREVAALRPGQRTALTCRLLGLTYKQAEQATGRTYTWVNRHVVEGRAALREAS